MRGFWGDAFYLPVILVILLMGLYLYFTVTQQLSTTLSDTSANDVKTQADSGIAKFVGALPFLWGLLLCAIVIAFAAIPISRIFIFIFAALVILFGIFLEQLDPIWAMLLANYATVGAGNVIFLIGQIRLVTIVLGLVMLLLGFVKGSDKN